MQADLSSIKRFFSKKYIGGEVSIHDLQAKEYARLRLTAEEARALTNLLVTVLLS
jgi:hypothetical protein